MEKTDNNPRIPWYVEQTGGTDEQIEDTRKTQDTMTNTNYKTDKHRSRTENTVGREITRQQRQTSKRSRKTRTKTTKYEYAFIFPIRKES